MGRRANNTSVSRRPAWLTPSGGRDQIVDLPHMTCYSRAIHDMIRTLGYNRSPGEAGGHMV